jgi:hypothetical protein
VYRVAPQLKKEHNTVLTLVLEIMSLALPLSGKEDSMNMKVSRGERGRGGEAEEESSQISKYQW